MREKPGINKSALCGELGVAWGTVAYHIGVLADAGLVEVEAAGREANLFPKGLAGHRRRMLVALRQPEARQVFGAVAAVREISLRDLCLRLGMSRKTVRRHVTQLLQAGLVEDKGSRRPRYAVLAGPGHAGLQTPPAPPALTGVGDSFRPLGAAAL